MLPDVVKVTKNRPRDEDKSKSIRITKNAHHSASSGSIEPQIRVKKLDATRPKRSVHTRSASRANERTNKHTSEAQNPVRDQRKNDAKSAENTRIETNTLQCQLTDCFVILHRLTEAQIVDANQIPVSSSNPHSSNDNDNDNDNANTEAADNSKVSDCSFIVQLYKQLYPNNHVLFKFCRAKI